MNKNLETALSLDAKVYLHDIERADLLVGIPSYNNVLTASYVLSQVVKGLDKYFPKLRSVIFVSDGKSADDTLTSVKKVDLPAKVKLIPAIYMGLSGKGTAVRAIFEAASYLKVKSVALVDSDLRSITPEWMKLLIGSTLNGTDFVAPYYNRRKYDGTITNFLCYPVTRSLFGKDIRQPIGGDFGLSIRLVEDILESNMWNEVPDINRFGIDIFETLTALSNGYNVKQAFLGVKNHDAKDPSSQLAGMFRQVMNTMFTYIEQSESVWKQIKGVSSVELVSDAKCGGTPEAITFSLPATIQTFQGNYDQHVPIYKTVLEPEIQSKLDRLKQTINQDMQEIDFTSEDWAKIVYSFIAEFHKSPVYGRDKLIDALRVLWIGRVGVFLKQTANYSRDECEGLIFKEAQVFEELKPYLISKY
jgi:glycosyltransferase involved in cell wall biosynthesis